MIRTAEIEAGNARKSDSEVSFKGAVFIEETLYNIFGFYAIPCVYRRHGSIGLRNRLYIGCNINVVVTAMWVTFFLALNVMHGVFYGTEGYVVTHFEVIIADLIYILRALTIGAKYAYYSRAELKEVDVRVLTPERIMEKLVLAGWTYPTHHLLFAELERSIVRVAPNLCTHKILYADKTSRDAMLWGMKPCIRSYMEYELGINVAAEAAKAEAAKRRAIIKAPRRPTTVTIQPGETVSVAADGTVSRKPLDGSVVVETEAEAEVDTEDKSLDAVAVRQLIAWLDSGSSKYCEYNLSEALGTLMAATAAGGLKRTGTSSSLASSVSAESEARRAPPPPNRVASDDFLKDSLPHIPAKLLCWHVLYASHITLAPSSNLAWYAAHLCGWIFAFIPVVVRGALGELQPFGDMWPSYIMEALLIYTAQINFAVTLRYVFVAPVDFARRLKAMDILNTCLDPMSPVATEFSIPSQQESRPPVDSSDAAARSSLAARQPRTMNLFPMGAMPMSRVATERVCELGSCNLGGGGAAGRASLLAGARGSSSAAAGGGGTWRMDGGARVTAAGAHALAGVGAPQHPSTFQSAFQSFMSVPVGIMAPSANSAAAANASDWEEPVSVVAADDLSAVTESGASGGCIEGWLVKRAVRTRGAFFNTNSWKNRYFVADSATNTISYSTGPSFPAIHTLRIDEGCQVDQFLDRPHAFRLSLSASGRSAVRDTLIAAASNQATRDAWIAFIRGMIGRAQQEKAFSSASLADRLTRNPLSSNVQTPLRGAEEDPWTQRQLATQGGVALRHQVGSPGASPSASNDAVAGTVDLDATTGVSDSEDEEDGSVDEAAGGQVNATKTIRSSILARHRLLVMDQGQASDAVGSATYIPVLYGENLVSWMSVRQIALDFGEAYKQRIQLYTAFFAIMCLVAVILLFFGFGEAEAIKRSDKYIMVGVAVFTQVVFTVALALAIVQGAKLNEATVLHRLRLSRIETLICDFLVAGETPNSACRALPWRAVHDSPVQRHLRLTRQVASSLSQSLLIETTIIPARVLFMPANYALLSTFWSLSVSGALSAVRTFNLS